MYIDMLLADTGRRLDESDNAGCAVEATASLQIDAWARPPLHGMTKGGQATAAQAWHLTFLVIALNDLPGHPSC